MTMPIEQLAEVIRLHRLWQVGDPDGVRANLIGANLSSADLSSADLSSANLSSADLSSANLIGANLIGANLSSANLSRADLIGANLSSANLSRANLIGADLIGANLSSANLSSANLSSANLSSADLSSADFDTTTLPNGVRIVTASGVGSAKRKTVYRADTDTVDCGCFEGTLDEFAAKIEETHKGNTVHLEHYRAMVIFFKAYRDIK